MSISLPIDNIKADFLRALEQHNMLILSAEPGAGKSTRLPLWLLDFAPFVGQKIYLLQPRRIAAKNVACYLAAQIGEPVGKTIGYRLRNDTKVSSTTKIEVITEGILTQIIQHDPELTDCALVILDEFHERSVQADLAYALCRDIQQGLRDDLRIMLMSATLMNEALQLQIPDAYALQCQGRSFPVDISYQAPRSIRQWREHALTIIKKSLLAHQGSILVFLPGSGDIRYLSAQLTEVMPESVILCPLYGDLSLRAQQEAIAPCQHGINKLVLATNIAETSLTIEGVTLVIDCGLEKIAIYDTHTLTNKLQQKSISKASAIQRAGRAGRMQAGKCIRLFSQQDFDRRVENGVSEIQQTDLLPLLIEAVRWGVHQLNDLPLLESPDQNNEQRAWSELAQLELIDEHRRLTTHGNAVAKLSCHPRFAHMIIKAQTLEGKLKQANLLVLACVLTALLEERDIFNAEQAKYNGDIRQRVRKLAVKGGAHQGIASRIFQQTQRLLQQVSFDKKVNITANFINQLPLEHCGILLALAYPERIAKSRARTGEYLAQNGKGISLHIEDAMVNETYLVAAQLSSYNHQLFIRLAAPLNIDQLIEYRLVKLEQHTNVGYDNQGDRITASQQKRLGSIVIEEQVLAKSLSSDNIAALWVEQVQKRGLAWLAWRQADIELLLRLRWLNSYQTQLELPNMSESNLMATLDVWFEAFVGQVKTKAQLDKADLSAMLMSMLDYSQQQRLSQVAPTHFVGPTGRRCPIRYTCEKAPIVSVPMQELYGAQATPCVGDKGHSIPLVLEIVSPAQRPIQVTQDLVAFWQGSYKAVQKEMKSRYPKHYWPDDPANAQATNKTKKHINGN
ncbi:ATP-dependent helicase HrpB [Colwelliaceae bacterium 6471]